MWAGPRWIPVDGPSPFTLEAQAGPLELPEPSAPEDRPATITAIDDVPARERRRGGVDQVTRSIGAALGATRSGLAEIRAEPGGLTNIPHCHSAEEELFVVTAGDGTLELLHPDGAQEEHAIGAGHVVARPPGTGVSHSFRAGGDGLTLLAHSDRQPSDLCFQPRSGKINVRGLKAIFRIQRVDYWDGEE
jgi:uncharacterized cupin superfamily protein